jgi:hypothetical protein
MQPLINFNVKAFVEVAETLLRSDDTLLALEFMDRMLPSWYRDNVPAEITDLKNRVMAKMATASFYATHEGFELTVTDEQCVSYGGSFRNVLIGMDVAALNEAGLTPHIWDMGPGEAALPMYLKAKGLFFTYRQIYVNQPTFEATKHRFADLDSLLLRPQDEGNPTIFVATEIIEHLHDMNEIRYEMQRRALCDVVHVSTPCYTYASNCEDWEKIGWLGHLRAMTPKEFRDAVTKMFPEYEYAHYQMQVQHMRLINKASKFEAIKKHYDIKA